MSEPTRPGRGLARSARLPVVLGLAGLLAAGGLADRSGGHRGPPPAAAAQPQPVAAPAAALTSSWFCAGATGAHAGAAPGELVIANAGSLPLSAHVGLVGTDGTRRAVVATVAPDSTATVSESLPSHPAWVGAVVDLDGGAAAVDQVVRGPLGTAASPCATAGSAYWYVATGQTLVNASDILTLLNPYPSDAVVDVNFTTDQGQEAPGDFQGLDVPAGGILAVDLGAHLRRRRQIAATIHARSGRVVAWDTELVTPPAKGQAVIGGRPDPSNPTSADPAAPAAGVVLTLGTPSVGTTWAWPEGLTGNGLDERYVIYNPSQQAASVSLSVALDQGQAEPFLLTVGPQAVTTVVADSQARIPPGVGHTAVLRSLNGVGVVAARTLTGVAPASQRGTGSLLGLRQAGDAWLVPLAATGGNDSLALLPQGANPIEVTVYGWVDGAEVALPGLRGLIVPAGQRSVIALSARAPGYRGAVVVRASGPIYVESDLSAAGGRLGLSLSAGVPLG